MSPSTGKLGLTGNCKTDKEYVFGAIQREAGSINAKFFFQPIGDRDQFSFEVSKGDYAASGTIVCSGERKGSDIWVGISGTTYDFLKGVMKQKEDPHWRLDNPDWRLAVVIVDSLSGHILYVPFELLEPEMRLHYVQENPEYHFHITDPSSARGYSTRMTGRNLNEYVDDWKHLFSGFGQA